MYSQRYLAGVSDALKIAQDGPRKAHLELYGSEPEHDIFWCPEHRVGRHVRKRRGPDIQLPLEVTFNFRGWAATMFWGCSRQFTRSTNCRMHCAQGLRDFVKYVLRHECYSAFELQVVGLFAQDGATVDEDGTVYFAMSHRAGYVDLQRFWYSVPERERVLFLDAWVASRSSDQLVTSDPSFPCAAELMVAMLSLVQKHLAPTLHRAGKRLWLQISGSVASHFAQITEKTSVVVGQPTVPCLSAAAKLFGCLRLPKGPGHVKTTHHNINQITHVRGVVVWFIFAMCSFDVTRAPRVAVHSKISPDAAGRPA